MSTPAGASEEFARLRAQYPGWELWCCGNGAGFPHSWHATRSTPQGTTVIAADSLAHLRRRLEQAEAKARR